MAHLAVTANDLRQGHVVYFTKTARWSAEIAEAWIVDGKDAAARLLAEAEAGAANGGVIGPYVFPVEPTPAGAAPLSQREKIRHRGPSVAVARELGHVSL